MTNMRDQIAAIVYYNEGYAAADAIMELVQFRIDKLEKVGKVFIDELTKVQARTDELEASLGRLTLEIETTKAEAARKPHSKGLNPRVEALKGTDA